MSEFKGTPGPWEVIESLHEGLVVIHKESLEEGQGWIGYTSIASELQGRDDANLIAAAPELLSALDLILSYHDEGNCVLHREDVSSARAAISKALGQ